MHLGGQTPILSSIELYDRLKEELTEFVKDLSEKGMIYLQVRNFRELDIEITRNHRSTVLSSQGRPGSRTHWLELEGKQTTLNI